MKHLYDILMEERVNYAQEIWKLRYLFFESKALFRPQNKRLSLAEFSELWFPFFKLKGNKIRFGEFLQASEFDKAVHDEETFCFLLEKVMTATEQLSNCIKRSDESLYFFGELYRPLREVIDYDLAELNLMENQISSAKFGTIVHIVAKDQGVIAAIESGIEKPLAESLLEYGRIVDSRNLLRKQKILKEITNTIDTTVDTPGFRSAFSETKKAVSYVLNNFNLRHPNGKGEKDEYQPFVEMNEEQVMEVYDSLYRLCLAVIAMNGAIESQRFLLDLKSKNTKR